MMFKVLFVCLMAVGALAQFDIPDVVKETIRREAARVCEKNNAANKTDDVVKAVTGAFDCVKALVDPATITKEITEAKPKGNLDEVFKKYCDKIPDFKVCLNGLSDGLKPCIGEEHTGSITEVRKGLDQVLDFVCYKDGDRIAMFIAESGPECLNDKREKVEECRKSLQKDFPSFEDFKKLKVEEQCGKFDELTTCVVHALEECSSPTPANMVEALLKFVRKSTPCPKKE